MCSAPRTRPTRRTSTASGCTCPTSPACWRPITQALGADRLNIEDFELHHLSPDRGGVLGILVAGEAEAGRAARLLEEQGYGVVVSPVTAG